MRLLRSTERDLVEPTGNPRYAILSHQWGQEEVLFHHIKSEDAKTIEEYKMMEGYKKIDGCCLQAKDEEYDYVWIDTCCIDKQSSSELSEAINSMFTWYQQSAVCYVFLNDVVSDEDPSAPGSSFRKSRWFTRGWTLQELIAPPSVVFFARDWTEIGTKTSLASIIQQITNIDQSVLLRNQDVAISIAKRMSWASKRQTKRVEDRAYSLMGLFGVNMPTIYGEGMRAFTRLQHEILKVSNDHSIFAWTGGASDSGLLATSPDQFEHSLRYTSVGYQDFTRKFNITRNPTPVYTLTNFGVQIQLPVKRMDNQTVLAYLACETERDRTVGVYLKRQKDKPENHYVRTTRGSTHIESVGPVDVADISVEMIFVAEANTTFYNSLEFHNVPRRQSYKFVFKKVDERFTVADFSPRKFWHNGSRLAMTLEKSGDRGVVVFRDTRTDKAFAAILGVHNYQVWSDIYVVSGDETAESITDLYWGDSTLSHIPWKALDWVKKRIGKKMFIYMTIRRKEVLANVGHYTVKISSK